MMASDSDLLQSISSRTMPFVGALMALVVAATISATSAPARTLQGRVESNGAGLSDFRVSLYASVPGSSRPNWQLLGVASTNDAGRFQVDYPLLSELQGQLQPILFVEAVNGPVMLASAIGSVGDAPGEVVVNERTTVAAGNAFAQFVHGSRIEGNTYGMMNAVHMAANLTDPKTGNVGEILASSPNGTETSTLATFNTLANAVANCVAIVNYCTMLFDATTPSGGPSPANVIEAVANIVKHPSYIGADGNLASEDPLFEIAKIRQTYTPALAKPPTNWLLFLKFTGGFYSAQDSNNLMNGPGNFAIDERGFAWVSDNYVPEAPNTFACAGRQLIKLYPWGQNFPGSPYFGGGLSGAGWGITFDPQGNLWIGNFGFQDPPCASLPQAAASNSVSEFRPDGTAISPSTGFTQGGISWPQGTVSDRQGNIWIANCGSDSVTKIPGGDPNLAYNIPLGPRSSPGEPQIKPFGAAVDAEGNVWFTDNFSNEVSVVSPEGRLLETLPGTYQGKTLLSHPVGNAVDSHGNIWVANSDWLDVPCPTRTNVGPGTNPSVTMYQAKTHASYPGSPFTGGGLTIPWGIAVDGNDSVWVLNFGAVPVGQQTDRPTGISRFCGIDTKRCPAGLHVGDPISPNTGYTSDALVRITAGQIDPSGNIWLANNWKLNANPNQNPGENAVVIAIGAAAPIMTPLIGPPVPFQRRHLVPQ